MNHSQELPVLDYNFKKMKCIFKMWLGKLWFMQKLCQVWNGKIKKWKALKLNLFYIFNTGCLQIKSFNYFLWHLNIGKNRVLPKNFCFPFFYFNWIKTWTKLWFLNEAEIFFVHEILQHNLKKWKVNTPEVEIIISKNQNYSDLLN